MTQVQITLDGDVIQGVFTKDVRDKAFSKLLETILNQVLEAQSEEKLSAARYESTGDSILKWKQRSCYDDPHRNDNVPHPKA